MKVLVIEDDPSLREIICRSLEKERYVTEEAPDFQTALEKTADYTYDCILARHHVTGRKRAGSAGRIKKGK